MDRNKLSIAIALVLASSAAMAEPYAEQSYVDSQIERLNGYTHGLAQGQEYLGERDVQQQAQLDSLDQQMVEKQEQLNSHQEQLNDKQVQLNDKQRQLNAHQEALNNHEERITRNTTAIGAVQNQANANTTAIAGQQTQLTNQQTTLTQQGQLLSQHSTQLTGLAATQVVQQNILNEYGTQLDSYGAQLSDLDSRMGAKWEAQNALDAKQDRGINKAQNMAAAAYAAATMQFCTTVDCGFQVAGAASTIGGKQGIAFGAGGAINNRVFLNATAVNAGSVRGASVGVTYSFR